MACGINAARIASTPVLGIGRSPASHKWPNGEVLKCGCVASHNICDASRIACGPKRAPGRLVTAPSNVRPASAKGMEGAELRVGPFKYVPLERKANSCCAILLLRLRFFIVIGLCQ